MQKLVAAKLTVGFLFIRLYQTFSCESEICICTFIWYYSSEKLLLFVFVFKMQTNLLDWYQISQIAPTLIIKNQFFYLYNAIQTS